MTGDTHVEHDLARAVGGVARALSALKKAIRTGTMANDQSSARALKASALGLRPLADSVRERDGIFADSGLQLAAACLQVVSLIEPDASLATLDNRVLRNAIDVATTVRIAAQKNAAKYLAQ